MSPIIPNFVTSSWSRNWVAAAGALLLVIAFAPGLVLAQPCQAPDNGGGTVTLPPAGCGYVSPTDLHMIIAGLPPGTTIEVGAEHTRFFNIVTTPGCGSLGGDCESFNSELHLNMKGTGLLAGFNRLLTMPATSQTHTGPRTPGASPQSFDTDMFGLQGQLLPGDPDFDLLRITAGTGFGMPSPGHTTLTRLSGGNWNADSFFDITYRIDFIGHSPGPLGGMSGSTTGTIRMKAGVPYTPPSPCVVSDNGTGTASLPPAGCGYVSPADLHMMIDGLPAGTVIEVAAEHNRFFNVVTTPGGSLGGEVEQFQSFLTLQMKGNGMLAGFTRTLSVQAQAETHVGPRTPGDHVQSFDTDMFRLQGQLPIGDPDFDLLRITAGTGFGMPSPGHTTLSQRPGGTWAVDSFFDITYRIDFVGHPGGSLSGMSGSTTGTIRMNGGTTITPPPPCVVPDASGTVALPPQGCGYVSPGDVHMIINGLPPGTTIEVGAQHQEFFNVTRTPGGSLGGEIENFSSSLSLQMTGTGSLPGYSRTMTLPIQTETHVGPRYPPNPFQDFDTDMFMMQGQLPIGDPDFDLLRITAGTGFGMPSPGHTTLTRLASGNWNVDSFFDITYRIDFIGKPGGPLGGMSGTTTATIRMQTGQPLGPCQPIQPGSDSFPSTGKLVLQMLDPTGAPSGDPMIVRASNANQTDAVVQRGPQIGTTIPTELISMSLRGSHPSAGGELFIRESPSLPSLGKLENVVQNQGDCSLASADSFFDVFVEAEVPTLGEIWSNQSPLHIQSKIDRLPPKNGKYENPFVNPVVLYDQATGLPRAQVLYEVHHVDPPLPPTGRKCFPTDIEFEISTQLGPSTLLASGPAQVGFTHPAAQRLCSISGVPCTTDTDCQLAGELCQLPPERIDTQIQAMDLTGVDPLYGPLRIRESPSRPSLGGAQSRGTDRTYPADSFFDVFVEVDLLQMGLTLHNEEAVPLVAVDANQPGISDVPPLPGTDFMTPANSHPIPLYDPSGQPFGVINRVSHRVGPPESCDPPPPAEDYCFESIIVLKVKIYATGCEETITLPGDFRILRGTSSDPGDGRDLMQTLMAWASLTGTSNCLGGNVSLGLSQSSASIGQVRSMAASENEPYDSFFDVFTELTSPALGQASVGPVHMTTTISSLPPGDGEIYYGPGTIIPLYGAGGTVIGEIEEVSHEVRRRLVPCPCASRPTMDAQIPSAFTMLTAGTGMGASYDWVRMMKTGTGSFIPIGWSCNAPPFYMDPIIPVPNQIFFILSRDKFSGFSGSYDDCDAGPLNWDALLALVCGP